jgi:hypothetical protein
MFQKYLLFFSLGFITIFALSTTPVFALTSVGGTEGDPCTPGVPYCQYGLQCNVNSYTCELTAGGVSTTPPPAPTPTPTPTPTPLPTSAQQSSTAVNPNDTPAITNPLNAPDLPTLLSEILSYVVEIGSIFLTLMLIFVGFQFVAARGNDEKLKSARSALMWTVIGGLLLLGAQALAVAIVSTVAAL